MVKNVLNDYLDQSAQEVKKEKTSVYTYGFINRRGIRKLRMLTVYKHAAIPFTYLGCPICS